MSETCCVDCRKRLSTDSVSSTWFTCSICGKPVCMDCKERHIPICMAITWGMAKWENDKLVPTGKTSSLGEDHDERQVFKKLRKLGLMKNKKEN